KAPFGAAIRAKHRGIPVIALAGKVPPVTGKALRKVFDVLLPITPEPIPLEMALKTTFTNLQRTAFELGNLLALRK
ncbi:MAG: glycerate kinase, partial [Chitinophagaceae bacterium]|nr:glycerate kinase [Chitinophagaceae bacterium]